MQSRRWGRRRRRTFNSGAISGGEIFGRSSWSSKFRRLRAKEREWLGEKEEEIKGSLGLAFIGAEEEERGGSTAWARGEASAQGMGVTLRWDGGK